MIENHISDLAIQESVFDPKGCDAFIFDHLDSCEVCRMKAAFYRNEFAMIKEMPKPAFDFDLSRLVLEKVGMKRAMPWRPMQIIYALLFVSAVIGSAYWIFGKYLHQLFTGFAYLMVYLLLAALVTFLGLQIMEVWRRYQQKIDALNFY
ncbi:MAG: hypothetical protein ACHQEM_03855 [Chitinophagales bacterium]